MGTYSRALEKAKDENFRQTEPLVDEVIQEKDLQKPQEPSSNLHQYESEKPPAPNLVRNGLNNDMEGWDEKLREIISGKSKEVAESIRMLRSRIFYPESGEPPRSILVTSAIPGEGKSFVCANLGVSIAQGLEKKALLVECDLRRPNLSKLLALSNTRGLVDFLQNGTPIDQLIQQTSMPKLSVLTSGKPPKNPAELLDTKKMAALVEKLENYDPERLIIFDSPPLQAASETDILAKRVDKIILVIRWGFARREHARQIVEMLGRDKIIGVVFNAFEMSRLESKLQGYYYGYKDYYSSYSKYYEHQPTEKRGKRSSS